MPGYEQKDGKRSSPRQRGSPHSQKSVSPGSKDKHYTDKGFTKFAKKRRNNKETKSLPIPRGNSPYAMAKRAEYEERNLRKAEYYYKQAITAGERVESALKDLASVLHQ